MGKFLKYQNVNFILNHFGADYSIIEKNEKNFSWGYPDHEMYNRSLEVLDSMDTNPRFDMYLTLSLHNPFKPPHKTYYDSLFSARLNYLSLNQQDKELTKTYSHVLATAMYTDDALKKFFNKYQHRKDFENTIFIITGDHRLGGKNKRNQIDTYHVPFIIYSPMLKKAEKFSSVSSHANVSPSLFSFFSKNHNFKMPNISHTLGIQIDTVRNFRNIHKVPFMRINRDVTDYLSNEYFITEDELFELKNHMILNKIENKTILDSLKNELNTFKIITRYTTENNLLSSDEQN
jgi:phosphoglycerol transferase MdoB-like AlkP superfamily enzyme